MKINDVIIKVLCHIGFFFVLRLYSRVWKYAGIQELLCILLGNVCGMGLFLGLAHFSGVPPFSVAALLCFFFNVSFICGSRFFVRAVEQIVSREDQFNRKSVKVLVVGAGDAGNIIVRDIRQRDYRTVVGFIDDDKTKHGKYMDGLPVLGGRGDIARVVEEQGVREIIIAIPSMSGKELAVLGQICSETPAEVKILPPFFNSFDEHQIHARDLRPLVIEDLLNRAPVSQDESTFGRYLEDKVVLVTGAGGSIGSEICRQILRKHPRRLILLGRGENSIYEINRELGEIAPEGVLVPYIDRKSVV